MSRSFESCFLFSFRVISGTFTLSNLGMFGVDRFDAILPPGTVSTFYFMYVYTFYLSLSNY